jgi:hypothetical protein
MHSELLFRLLDMIVVFDMEGGCWVLRARHVPKRAHTYGSQFTATTRRRLGVPVPPPCVATPLQVSCPLCLQRAC